MKQVKYLYSEAESPKDMISVSQLQTYLSCKKKWAYNYIDNITPRVDRSYLTIGKLCHKGMQVAMTTLWSMHDPTGGEHWRIAMGNGVFAIKDEWEEYMSVTPLLDEEIPDMDQMLSDAVSIFKQAFEEFEPWKYEVLSLKKKGQKELIPALELHFKVPCRPTKGLHGYIDAILRDKETGFVWCVDYKFRKSLAPDDDEAFNIQNAVYSYACEKMGIDISGTMTWQHLNTPAADPQILKTGGVSKAKIKTTLKHYTEFCEDHNIEIDKDLLSEMSEKLKDIEWFRATLEYRNKETIKRIWDNCILPVAKEIKHAHTKKANNYPSLYPWNCKMCQYQSLCQAELRDYDVEAIKEREYTRRTTRKEGEATEAALAPAT